MALLIILGFCSVLSFGQNIDWQYREANRIMNGLGIKEASDQVMPDLRGELFTRLAFQECSHYLVKHDVSVKSLRGGEIRVFSFFTPQGINVASANIYLENCALSAQQALFLDMPVSPMPVELGMSHPLLEYDLGGQVCKCWVWGVGIGHFGGGGWGERHPHQKSAGQARGMMVKQ